MEQEKKKKSEGFAVIAVGKTGVGKSTQARIMLDSIVKTDPKRKLYIFDPNQEFTEYGGVNSTNWKDFADIIKDVKDSFIFVEEATISLDNRKKEGVLVDLLVKKRHDNNIILMNFHSWRAVPYYIFDLINYVLIFKTNDRAKVIENKCDMQTVIDAYNFVMNSKNKFEYKYIDLYA